MMIHTSLRKLKLKHVSDIFKDTQLKYSKDSLIWVHLNGINVLNFCSILVSRVSRFSKYWDGCQVTKQRVDFGNQFNTLPRYS